MNNVYIEQSLSHMHQEDMMREVRANRSAKRSRIQQARSFSVRSFPGLFSLSLKRA